LPWGGLKGNTTKDHNWGKKKQRRQPGVEGSCGHALRRNPRNWGRDQVENGTGWWGREVPTGGGGKNRGWGGKKRANTPDWWTRKGVRSGGNTSTKGDREKKKKKGFFVSKMNRWEGEKCPKDGGSRKIGVKNIAHEDAGGEHKSESRQSTKEKLKLKCEKKKTFLV